MLASSLLFRTPALKKDQQVGKDGAPQQPGVRQPRVTLKPSHSPTADAEDPISKADNHICETRLIRGPARAGTRRHLLKHRTAWNREEPTVVTERKRSKLTSPGRAHDPGLQGTFIPSTLEVRL